MGLCTLLWIPVLVLVRYSECSCSLPANIVGSWTSSEQGSLTFTSTSLLNYPTTTFGSFTFTCDVISDSLYVLKSPTFTYLSITFEAYLCFVMTEISPSKYTYFIGSEPNINAGNDRLRMSVPSIPLSVTEACNRSIYPSGTYYFLLKDGELASARTDCPADLQFVWTYSYDTGSGSDVCAGNVTSADVCSDTTSISANYTACSQMIMYSNIGVLYCLHSYLDGPSTYITMYNTDTTIDESTTYRFICLVMTSHGDVRYVTQFPKQCHDNQTSTDVVSPGASLVFTVSQSCSVRTSSTPSTTSTTEEVSSVASGNTGAIALGIVIPFIVIIIVVIVFYYHYQKYQIRKIEDAAKPDPKFANGEIRNRRRNIHDGVVNPDHNGNVIRRQDSIVISIPMTSREDYNQSALWDEGDDFDLESNDEGIEINGLNEFSFNNKIIPRVVQSATPYPPSCTDGTNTAGACVVEAGAVSMDKNNVKKKKKRRKRRKWAKCHTRSHAIEGDERGASDGENMDAIDEDLNRKLRTRTKKSRLNTKDTVTFGTATLLLKIPKKVKKKDKKYLVAKVGEDDRMSVVDEKEYGVFPDTTEVHGESAENKAHSRRIKRGEISVDLIKKRKTTPVIRHRMESHHQVHKSTPKAPSIGWGNGQGSNTPKACTAMTDVEQTGVVNICTPRRDSWKQYNCCYDDRGVVVGT